MTNWNNNVSNARKWATSHLVLAGVICGGIGLVLGGLLF